MSLMSLRGTYGGIAVMACRRTLAFTLVTSPARRSFSASPAAAEIGGARRSYAARIVRGALGLCGLAIGCGGGYVVVSRWLRPSANSDLRATRLYRAVVERVGMPILMMMDAEDAHNASAYTGGDALPSAIPLRACVSLRLVRKPTPTDDSELTTPFSVRRHMGGGQRFRAARCRARR